MAQSSVSLLMTIYGRAEYLPETLNSVLAAKGNLKQIVLVDDGSRDNALDVITEYSRKDSRIEIISKENTGIADSSNVGLGICTGDYIARLDSDDLMMPSRILKQAEYLDKNLDVVAVGSSTIDIDEAGNVIRQCRKITPKAGVYWGVPKFRYIAHPSAMIRRSAIMAVSGYRTQFRFAEDADLWLRLLSLGKIYSLDEPLTKYRVYEGMSSKKFRFVQDIANLLAILCWLLRANGMSDEEVIRQDTWEGRINTALDQLSGQDDMSMIRVWSATKVLKHKNGLSEEQIEQFKCLLLENINTYSLHPGWVRLRRNVTRLAL